MTKRNLTILYNSFTFLVVVMIIVHVATIIAGWIAYFAWGKDVEPIDLNSFLYFILLLIWTEVRKR